MQPLMGCNCLIKLTSKQKLTTRHARFYLWYYGSIPYLTRLSILIFLRQVHTIMMLFLFYFFPNPNFYCNTHFGLTILCYNLCLPSTLQFQEHKNQQQLMEKFNQQICVFKLLCHMSQDISKLK